MEPLEPFPQLERLRVRSLEKNLTELFDVFGVAVTPARVGGKQFGSLLQFGSHVTAVGDAVEAADELLAFLRQDQVDKKLARIRVLRFGAERDRSVQIVPRISQ